MFLRRHSFLVLPFATLLAGIAGCGSGPLATQPASELNAMTGVVHGGQSPIQNATVHLYHTNTAATTYGAAAVLIGSGITDGNGGFSIGTSATSANCPAGSQAYITAAGGYQSGQPALINNEMLMMAALGDCSTISASTTVLINEVTTVAAAYALSSFTSTALDGSNTFYTANIGAPAANNASTISATTPAGLAHAFQNAAHLVSFSNGLPNATYSANLSSSTAGAAAGTSAGSVPVNEILTLGDIMQSCVNSVSGSSGAIASIPVSFGGSGYGATVNITGGLGTGATANAIVSPAGVVTGLTITNPGSGYSPAVSITNSSGAQAVVVPSLVNGAINGYAIQNDGQYGPIITVTPSSGTYSAGTGAAIGATLSSAGVPTAYIVNTGGAGYGPVVTVSAPTFSAGTTATVNATISGASASSGGVTLALATGGTGYGPSVTITNSTSGSGATATATLSGTAGAVTALTLGAGGTGYPASSTFPITIQAPPGTGGTTATGTATTSAAGVVTSVALATGGAGYTLPTITVGAPSTGTSGASAGVPTVVNGIITSIGTSTAGSGYIVPTIAESNGSSNGTGAVPGSVTVLNGKITGLLLGTAGSNYAPVVAVTAAPTGGTTSTGTATVTGGGITAVTLTAGAGYGPTVTIAGTSTTAAAATSTIGGGALTALNLTAAGAGYGVPTVTITSTSGDATATATATTTSGVVTSINVTNGGSGYSSSNAPTVTLSAPGGTGNGTATAGTPVLVADSSSGTVAPSPTCSTLFTNTPSIGGSRPANTLQAFMNLARNPYPSAAAVSNLFGAISGSPAFQPALTTAPSEWSIAITYNSGFNADYWMGMDMNDTLYITPSSTTATLPAIQGLSAYGISVPTFGAPTITAAGRGVAADALGNIWVSTNSAFVQKYSASAGGAPTAYPTLASTFDVAVDASNNVWTSAAIATGSNIEELSAASSYAANYTAGAPGGPYGLFVDANQNVWAATYYSSGANGLITQAAVLPNVGTVTAPNYNPAGTVITPVTTTFADGAMKAYSIVTDASGNAWFDIYGGASTSTSGIEEVIPNSPTNITSLAGQAFILGTTATSNGVTLGTSVTNRSAIDGAGTLFIADNTIPVYSIVMYNTVNGATLSPVDGIVGCYLASTSTTTCTYATNSPRSPTIDSTGTVWAGITGGGVAQFIGLAAPAYPLISVGKPGLSPGLTVVNPLP